MIAQSLVDGALNRLSVHFGSKLVVRPPATAGELAALESCAGPLPRDLTIFLSTCNGLRVEVDAPDGLRRLWHTHEMVHTLRVAPGPGLVPVRGAADGERNSVVVIPGVTYGAVVRWDPWAPRAELLASCLGGYLDAWSRFLVDQFDRDGHPLALRPEPSRLCFTVEHIIPHDPAARRWREDIHVERWLNRLNHQVACGDDFE